MTDRIEKGRRGRTGEGADRDRHRETEVETESETYTEKLRDGLKQS